MLTISVPVTCASMPYIENVGGMSSIVRPGPPHASSRSKMSSSPPLPTSTFSVSSPLASAMSARSSLSGGVRDSG